jgi:hypothetical protein
VRTIGKEQMVAAKTTFTEVATTFSKAVTLQQLLYVNYRDATKHRRDGDAQAIETKNARALIKQYDDMRTELRESIDLSARRVEITLDWASNASRDGANAGEFGLDPMSRLALGAYDFQCDDDKYMPSFETASVDVPVPPALRKDNPKAGPLRLDWYSTKHQLLTLYYASMPTTPALPWSGSGLRTARSTPMRRRLSQKKQKACKIGSTAKLPASILS